MIVQGTPNYPVPHSKYLAWNRGGGALLREEVNRTISRRRFMRMMNEAGVDT